MSLEEQVRKEWKWWGTGFAMFTRCDNCGEVKNCRGKKRLFMLCMECFDLTGGKKKRS